MFPLENMNYQSAFLEEYVNMFRTVVSIIVMIFVGIVGFFLGAAVNDCMGGAILFVLIAGIACIVYVIDNQNSH
jgi:K+ transporter